MAFFSKNTSKTDNPWEEDARDRAKASRAVVLSARTRVVGIMPKLPRIKPHLQAFIDDLDYIEIAYANDPTAFRKNRALTAVHLPGILTGLETLIQMQSDKVDSVKLAAIENEITFCFAAASQARAVLSQNATTASEIETAVLKDAINPASDKDVRLDQAEANPKTGIMGHINGYSRTGGKAIMGGIAYGRDRATELGSDAADRVGAGTGLAKTYLSGLVEDGIDLVTSPIARRVNAIGSALSTATAGAIGGGLVSAVVFPPAVPFVIGLALLDGSSTYGDALEAEDERERNDRKGRHAERQSQMTSKMNKLRGRSPVIRMETQHVHVIMNADTGQSQGIILTGRHAGDSLMDLDRETLSLLGREAPDKETREIIYAWRNRMMPADQPNAGAASRDTFATSDELGLGIDLLSLAALP